MPTDKQRREAQRRRMQRQLQSRREREVVRRRRNLIISVIGTLLIVGLVLGLVFGLGGSDDKTSAAGKSSSAAPTSSAAPSSPSASPSKSVAAYPCTWSKSMTPAAKKASVPSTTTPSRKGTTAVTLTTNRGALTLSLNRAAAPCAVESFVSLTQQKYFDNTPCHRLVTSGIYVLQCGDPSGAGTGGPGYSFADELSGKEKYTRGELAMANSGPNTNGSQFFIVYKDSPLPASYTVFGTVSKGLDVVDKVAAAGAVPAAGGQAGDGKPKLPVTISKAAVG